MALTYIGTRDAKIRAAASEAILRGICPDGGLYIPEEIPGMGKTLEELAKLEAERGTPGYVSAGKGIFEDGRKMRNKAGKNGSELPVDTSGKSGRVASNEMCTFLILNISSLQLIPVNMIAYRQQYGSVNPAGIIAPAIVATIVSTLTAVVYCKVKNRKQK